MERRHFLQYLGAGMISVTMPTLSQAQDKKPSGKIIVVGGGLSGATVAKYLRLWGGEGVDVTLINADAQYNTCIHSSMVLSGQRQVDDLVFDYQALSSKHGVKFVHDQVMEMDTGNKEVTLKAGNKLNYDKLVVAPGIDFDYPEGMSADDEHVLHAWKGGAQVTQLKQQIDAMSPGDTFILSIPKMPYRCPPGPYERACLVADYLREHKPTCRIIVTDANEKITAGGRTFGYAFEHFYQDNLVYLPDTQLQRVDHAAQMIETSQGNLRGNVFNIIPPQRAGKIIAQAGLDDVDQRWAGVNMMTYESTAAKDVYVIGDAAATTQPKAGHIANAEAKVCADAIISSLLGQAPNPNPRTTSACYTTVSQTSASWLTIVYKYDAETQSMVKVKSGEGYEINERNFGEMRKWYDNLMQDTFA